MKAYKQLFGNADPFHFECPLPLAIRGFMETQSNASDSEVQRACCEAYRKLSWPYQFPECTELTECPSCFQASASSELARHPPASLAGAAWAAVVTTKGHAKRKWGWMASKLHSKVTGFLSHAPGAELVDGKRMRAALGNGLDHPEVDLCPKIGDWEVNMLNEEDNNIHARIFKSRSAKLAIIAFRGTQATSMKNWQVDADIKRKRLPLGPGEGAPGTLVHEGFLTALERVLPLVKRWIAGYMFHYGAVPRDWQVVFTGHSLGGALAILATTIAEAENWNRKPDVTITWGAPRVADSNLSAWWESQELCHRLLRVNTYNDVIHWFPFKKMWNWWSVARDMMSCVTQMSECLKRSPTEMLFAGDKHVVFSDTNRWMHVCNESEFVVPAAMEGLNEHLQDFNPIGAVLSHFVANCRFGYSYGVMHGGIAQHDAHCGLEPSMCAG